MFVWKLAKAKSSALSQNRTLAACLSSRALNHWTDNIYILVWVVKTLPFYCFHCWTTRSHKELSFDMDTDTHPQNTNLIFQVPTPSRRPAISISRRVVLAAPMYNVSFKKIRRNSLGRDSLVVKRSAYHAGGPGSIPGAG